MKLFASGSCRILTTMNNGNEHVTPIHSMFRNYEGINFLGKLHNSKHHIQFIKYIRDELVLPDHILHRFMTVYNSYVTSVYSDIAHNLKNKEAIKTQFDECEWYVFEICSLKIYNHDGYEVQHELSRDSFYTVQTEEELINDLKTIRELIPVSKKILFQCHFRPNIIHDDETKRVESRDIIYNAIRKFCETSKNSFMYDPSGLIKSDHSLFNGNVHFNHEGHVKSLDYMCENYFLKFNQNNING